MTIRTASAPVAVSSTSSDGTLYRPGTPQSEIDRRRDAYEARLRAFSPLTPPAASVASSHDTSDPIRRRPQSTIAAPSVVQDPEPEPAVAAVEADINGEEWKVIEE